MISLFQRLGRSTLWLIAAVTVVAVTVMSSHFVLKARTNDPLEIEPLPVAVMKVAYQDTYKQRALFSGRIAPAQVADIGFQVSGEVAEVLVEIGDRVEKGDELARLDPVRVELRQRQERAQLDEARAVLNRAELTRARIVSLVDQGFATDQELDDATAERNSARERTRALERSLSRADEDLKDAVLRAPFTGFVVGRYVDAGVTLSAGAPVVRLNEQAALEAKIGVSTELARNLAIGDSFDLISGPLIAAGTVAGISDDVDPKTRTQTVRFVVDEDPGFVPGNLVRVALERERSGRGVWVPMASLQEGYRGLWSIYVADMKDGEDIIARKDIEIISLSDERAFVTGTLEAGDRLVTTSPFRFVPGQRVRVVTEHTPTEAMASVAVSTVR